MSAEYEHEEKKFAMVAYRINEAEFSVLSLNSTFGKPKQYTVRWIGYKWICSCPDGIVRLKLREVQLQK